MKHQVSTFLPEASGYRNLCATCICNEPQRRPAAYASQQMVKTRSKLVPGSESYRAKILAGTAFCAAIVWLYISFGSSLSSGPSRDLQQVRNRRTLSDSDEEMALKSVNFEVFGRVQGVFFRKYTEREANKLKLVGWCMNTRDGTVKGVLCKEDDKYAVFSGQMQGPSSALNNMRHWLQHTGSPQSHIARAEFTDERDISKLEFDGFSVRH